MLFSASSGQILPEAVLLSGHECLEYSGLQSPGCLQL